MLDFVSRYRPANADEVYDIMNALDDRLATPNSAVVLATVRVFLNMTLSMPYDHQQVPDNDNSCWHTSSDACRACVAARLAAFTGKAT